MKHKWHKEIKAWADGCQIEALKAGIWFETDYPAWDGGDYQFRIKSQLESIISHSCRSDGVCKCEQPTQEHSMTYEDGFAHGYDAYLADYKEQPTQEPMIIKQDNGMVLKLGYDDLPNGTPFYTHPKEWQGLSDDDINGAVKFLNVRIEYPIMFARLIEMHLKEKNG